MLCIAPDKEKNASSSVFLNLGIKMHLKKGLI